MKKSEETRLLHEVLADADYAAFRRRLLAEALGDFRGGQSRRGPWRALSLAAAMIIFLGIWSAVFWPRRATIQRAPVLSTEVIRTAPLPSAQIITTAGRRPSASERWLSVRTATGSLPVVRTPPETVPTVTDQQLLDLLRGHSVALISLPGGERSLVFLDDTGEL